MLRVFIENESGEPAAYCGDLGSQETIKAIGYFIQAELESTGDIIKRTGSATEVVGYKLKYEVPLTLIVKEMSDSEVEALPDL